MDWRHFEGVSKSGLGKKGITIYLRGVVAREPEQLWFRKAPLDAPLRDVEAPSESDAAATSNRKSPWNGVDTSSRWSFQCQRVRIRPTNGEITGVLHNG